MRSGESSHSTVAQLHEQLLVGYTLRSGWADLLRGLASAVREAQGCSDRSAAGGKAGHQKTPAFIHASLAHIMQGGLNMVHPRGCFADVGRHTGGEPRSTCWPLVRSVAQVWRIQL